MNNIYSEIYRCLSGGQTILTATIYSSQGSSPRTSGAKMIIMKDRGIYGTIGGGRLEAQVIEASRDVFKNKKNLIMKFDLKGVRDTDMICGGEVEVIIEYLSPQNQRCMEVYRKVALSIANLKSFYMITSFDIELNRVNYDLYRDGRFIFDSIENREDIAKILRENLRQLKSVKYDKNLTIIEPILTRENVFIFGAGHVSRQIAKLTDMVDFNTVILDDRSEFANRDNFPTADKIIVLDDFENSMGNLGIDNRSYIIIVTRGHKSDLIVLKQALKTPAYYIGGMGSKRKKAELFGKLRHDGSTEMDLKRVFIPIGIEIGSDTPEEIAVSIVAELIQKRAENIKSQVPFAINDKD